jgi:hypothetical protein
MRPGVSPVRSGSSLVWLDIVIKGHIDTRVFAHRPDLTACVASAIVTFLFPSSQTTRPYPLLLIL